MAHRLKQILLSKWLRSADGLLLRLRLRTWRSRLFAVVIALVFSVAVLFPGKGHATTATFTTSGTWTVPSGVSSAVFEAWGGGGAGGGTTVNSSAGGGGAGGQYAKTTLTGLAVNDVYTVTVSGTTAGSSAGSFNGGDSYVVSPSSTTIVLAAGGGGGNSCCGTQPAGGVGSTSGGVGDVVNAGGSGANGSTSSATSGGGGGGAGSSGSGGNASGTTGGTGTSTNGGNGSNGGTGNFTGTAGSNYGGGGSGGSKNNGGNRNGGTGAQGLVTVTYTANSSPAAPTLSTPASGATGVSLAPSFTLRTTDPENDYLRYKIVLYQSDCSTVVTTADETSSQTGWSGQDTQSSTAYVGNSTLSSSTVATYTYQSTLTANTTYCWKAAAIDPGGSNTFGSFSATQSFTTNAAPAAPTLSTPSSGATGVSVVPAFTLRTTDADADYLRYKIVLYQSDCSTVVATADQTSSQTGWSGQDQQTSTAYTGAATIGSSTLATYTYTGALSNSTTYCWQAAAIDPGGTNAFSSFSATQSFTTVAASSGNSTVLNGGISTGGGIHFGN